MGLNSENHILASLAHYFPQNDKFSLKNEEDKDGIVMGRGDDCAIVRISKNICISTDMFIEDIHFRRRYFKPEEIGWKALAVNLSDLAGTCAKPIGFTMALALPPDADQNLTDGIFQGMSELANLANIQLLGGDLSRADKMHLCVTVLGQSSHPVCRNQGKIGDSLFLLGNIGLSRTGLVKLEAENRHAIKTYPESCNTHLRPMPHFEHSFILHEILKDNPGRIGLMDVSDGLAQDIPRLIGCHPSGNIEKLKNSLGVELTLPGPHPEITRYCTANELDITEHMLKGGEDYALIGTCDSDTMARIKDLIPQVHILGILDKEPGIRCKNKQVLPGFDHFG